MSNSEKCNAIHVIYLNEDSNYNMNGSWLEFVNQEQYLDISIYLKVANHCIKVRKLLKKNFLFFVLRF